MFRDQVRYEVRIMGRWVFLTPILVILCVVFMAGLLVILHTIPLRIAQILTGSLEMLLPLAAGIVTTTVISHDPALELQLTMPQKYPVTAMGRLSLTVAWTGAVSFIASIFIYHWKFLRIPTQVQTWGVVPQVLIEQLTWLAPLLWFTAVGLCLPFIIRSRVASSAFLAGIWIIEAIFYGYFLYLAWLKPLFLFPTTLAPSINFWLLNRYELLGTATLLFPLGWLLLHNSEALLQGSAGEE
jgi:hypothetical protein